jgi:hypothetical protein
MTTTRRRVLIGLAALLGISMAVWFVGIRCKEDNFPQVLVGDEPAGWTRGAMVARYGQPTEQDVGPPRRLLLARDHSYQVVQLLQAVPPAQEVELLVWRSYCRGRLTAEMAAVFEPQTGKILEANGKLLFDLYRVL